MTMGTSTSIPLFLQYLDQARYEDAFRRIITHPKEVRKVNPREYDVNALYVDWGCSGEISTLYYHALRVIIREWNTYFEMSYGVWQFLLTHSELIDELHAINPKALQTTTTAGNIFHMTAFHNDADVFNKIAMMYPEGMRGVSSVGYLPIHYALNEQRDTDSREQQRRIIQRIVADNPACLLSRGQDGRTPLIQLCRNYNEYMIEYVYTLCPEAITLRDDMGDTALHAFAYMVVLSGSKAEKRERVRVFDFLYSKYPEAIRMRNKQNKMPLHNIPIYSKTVYIVRHVFQLFRPALLRWRDFGAQTKGLERESIQDFISYRAQYRWKIVRIAMRLLKLHAESIERCAHPARLYSEGFFNSINDDA